MTKYSHDLIDLFLKKVKLPVGIWLLFAQNDDNFLCCSILGVLMVLIYLNFDLLGNFYYLHRTLYVVMDFHLKISLFTAKIFKHSSLIIHCTIIEWIIITTANVALQYFLLADIVLLFVYIVLTKYVRCLLE